MSLLDAQAQIFIPLPTTYTPKKFHKLPKILQKQEIHYKTQLLSQRELWLHKLYIYIILYITYIYATSAAHFSLEWAYSNIIIFYVIQ